MIVKNHMAILRNLRNIQEAGVSEKHMTKLKRCFSHDSWGRSKILPFRFIAAAKHAPRFEEELGKAMIKSLASHEKLPGQTVLLVDVSGSMKDPLSDKTDINRIDAACGLAMLLREICEDVLIYSFSMELCEIPPRHGFALRDAILSSQRHSGTPLGLAVRSIYAPKGTVTTDYHFGGFGHDRVKYSGQNLSPDRLIVITDEQSQDPVPDPDGLGYMINVASYQNGVGYGPWKHVEGWSENVVRYIQELETHKLI
jgi:60 kDa SS-A/Ro ribonucleoprotein